VAAARRDFTNNGDLDAACQVARTATRIAGGTNVDQTASIQEAREKLLNLLGQELYSASEKGQLDQVMSALERGADPLWFHQQDERTPLLASCEQGRWECARVIVENLKQKWDTARAEVESLSLEECDGTQESQKTKTEETSEVNPNKFQTLEHPASHTEALAAAKDLEVEKATALVNLLGAKDKHGCSVLWHLAADVADSPHQVMTYIFDVGDELRSQEAKYTLRSPLSSLNSASRPGWVDLINLQCDNGSTALHRACVFGNRNRAELLMKRGAFVNLQDNEGNTPLVKACQAGSIEGARVLIDFNHANNKTAKQSNIDGDALNSLAMKWARTKSGNNQHCDRKLHDALIEAQKQEQAQAHLNMNLYNVKGHTALDFAYNLKIDELISLLTLNGAHRGPCAISQARVKEEETARRKGLHLNVVSQGSLDSNPVNLFMFTVDPVTLAISYK